MLLYAQLAILVVLVILNAWFGIEKGMYELVWWWDIPAHFLGGAWAGVFGVWALQKYRTKRLMWEGAFAALLIGIFWEIFEVYFELGRSLHMSHFLDTTKDLIIDTMGGALAGFIAYHERALWRKRR